MRSLLIAEVPEATVRTVLRLLVDSLAPAATVRPSEAPSQPAPRPAAAAPPSPRHKLTLAPIDPDWDELRRQVRTTLTERGLDYGELSQAVGRSAVALKIDLSRRRPASPSLQTKLRIWLEQAPAVAAPLPFRRSGSVSNGSYDRASSGNGVDHDPVRAA